MTQTVQAIGLRGSVETVVEYFGFAVNSILYQRGVYPVDSFHQVKKYGMPLMVSTSDELNAYLANLLQQVAQWVSSDQCRLIAILIVDPSVDVVMERWEFVVEVEKHGNNNNKNTSSSSSASPRKSEEAVRREVQAVLRQITACVSFLPFIDVPCAFDVVVYTSMDADVPSAAWEMSDPRRVEKGSEIQLKSFSTSYHTVATAVSFRE